MTFLDLCAGIGGLTLGLTRAGMTCVGQVEIDLKGLGNAVVPQLAEMFGLAIMATHDE